MISNFKQHYRGVTTSIVAPPVLLFAKVSARRAKYKAKVQKLSLLFPSRRLTCAWVEVQGERNTKKMCKNFRFLFPSRRLTCA